MKSNEGAEIIKDINRKKMENEIKLRMESDSWNLSIAHKVMEIQSVKNEKNTNIWSFASLATAAMSFLIFMASVYTVTYNNGTHNGSGSIYSYAYIKDSRNLDNDVIAAGLELTINEAYPMR